jgi:hypothetical protein
MTMLRILPVIFILLQVHLSHANPILLENKELRFDFIRSNVSKHVVVLKRSLPDFKEKLQQLIDLSYTCMSAPYQVVKCHLFNSQDVLPTDIYSTMLSRWENVVINFGNIKNVTVISEAPALVHWEIKQQITVNNKKYKGYSFFMQADGNMKIEIKDGPEFNLNQNGEFYRLEQVSSHINASEYRLHFTKIFFMEGKN